MKKIFAALTAFTCAVTVFTGCGKTDNDNEKSSGKKSAKVSEDDLMEITQNLADAALNMDIQEILKLSLPDDLAASAYKLSSDYIDDLMDEMEYEDIDVSDVVKVGTVKSVKKTKDIDEDYLLLIEKGFSLTKSMTDYMIKNDIDFEDFEDMDEDELMETPLGSLAGYFEDYEDDLDSVEDFIASGVLDKIKSKYTITAGCMADVTIEIDGSTETLEVPFYNIKGEGWNGDLIVYPTVVPAMLGYVQKSKQTSVNSTASSVRTAANAALVDLDEYNDVDIYGDYIISSDESLNFNLSSDFEDHLDDFYDCMQEYFTHIDKIDYFVVVTDGYVAYAACKNKDNDEYIGTYPYSTIPTGYDGYDIETKSLKDSSDYTYEDIYDMALELLY